MPTPAELYNGVVGVVKEQQEYTQALIYETVGLRWGEVELVGGAAPVTVTLNQPFATGVTDYVIWRQAYTAEEEQSEVVIIPGSQTETSFQVWAPQNVTFKFITTFPTITITP
jgi:hypothetical protein